MPADVYDLCITDANGCTLIFTGILTISEPPVITLIVNSSSDVTCYGGSDGGADITITEEHLSTYITGPARAPVFLHRAKLPTTWWPISYDINVTDANGCLQNFPGLLSIWNLLIFW